MAHPYGRGHRQLRRQWAGQVARGEVVCPRCEEPIKHGEQWDLGHPDPADAVQHCRPEHAVCNRSAGGRARHGLPPAQRGDQPQQQAEQPGQWDHVPILPPGIEAWAAARGLVRSSPADLPSVRVSSW